MHIILYQVMKKCQIYADYSFPIQLHNLANTGRKSNAYVTGIYDLYLCFQNEYYIPRKLSGFLLFLNKEDRMNRVIGSANHAYDFPKISELPGDGN